MKRGLITEALLLALLAGCPAATLPGCGIDGINAAKPETRVEFDPINHTFKFKDSKDNNVDIKGLKAKTATGAEGSVDEFSLRNNASDVRAANVNQLLGMAAEATANWQGAAAETKAIGEILAQVMPFVPQAIAASALNKLRGATSITGPGGIGVSNSGNMQLADQLLKMAGTALPVSKPPASQATPQ